MLSSPAKWKEFFEKYYRNEINSIADNVKKGKKARAIWVDVAKDLIIFEEMKLYEELLDNPDLVIRHANAGIRNAHNIFNVQLECNVRFYNLPKINRMLIKDIKSDDVLKFVSVEGLVRRATFTKPFFTTAVFECNSCGRRVIVDLENDPRCEIKKPYMCPDRSCGRKSFTFLPELSEKIDSQVITIQDYPENLKGGEEPRSINIFVKEDLVDMVKPGDRIAVNGIPRILKGNKAMGDIFIDANSIETIETEYEEIKITKEDEQRIIELSKEPEIYSKIVSSIAPTIYGYEEIKLAIALQLFGGTPKKLADGSRIRGDIHILLVGDPGIAKSKILNWIKDIAPRAILTSGKGASSAGLTASCVKSEIDGRWSLEAGALVLADKGVSIVDEIDKMDSKDREALHEAMEQQQVSISKAGINTVLRARCSLLAAANPKYGRFDRFAPIADQIDLPPTLLSRFDLIFIMTDDPDKEKDAMLAKQILRSHTTGGDKPQIEPQFLKKYIAYAKRRNPPVLSDGAKSKIEDYFVRMRSKAKENSPVPITARQLEALIRLSEASARIRLSDIVTEEDAERAINLMNRCLSQVAVDMETGEIDIDRAFTGTPKSTRDRIFIMKEIVRELEERYEKVPEKEILDMAEERGIGKKKAKEIIDKLVQVGDLYQPEHGKYRIVV
jgi:replicative DNA helicase Mcm